ncbi:Saccharopine dehydrogenase-domain-containing protein [Paraphysoderma sedebokerense]|nr:Saccharopine dehydrogenase-domain-containing protein [Paraphysoderma sedebokerense]
MASISYLSRRIKRTLSVFSGSYASCARNLHTIGVRRETKHKWERRVPVLPEHVDKLTKAGIPVIVQPSTNRVIADEQYRKVGATISNDLSSADIILGIKEVPMNQFIPGKTYVFFSHTHKGQAYNMPMLNDILDKRIRLIDYELITDESQRRLVLFGTFAGYAGMIDGLHSLGLRMLSLGYGTPFLNVGMAHTYISLAHAKNTIKELGTLIQRDGLAKDFGPMVFVFTGTGNVSKGAQEVFKCLPHEFVKPTDLKSLTSSKDFDNKKVYASVVDVKDYIVDKSGNALQDPKDYFQNPHKYQSDFAKKIAPHATMLITGNYWDSKYPRLITINEAKNLAADWEKNKRMLTVADISCDIRGSLEFMSHSSTIDNPFFVYDPITGREHDDLSGPGVQIMSIDILPSELPLEASQYFGNALFPFLNELAKGNFSHPVLKRATIAEDGSLTEKHKWLKDQLPTTKGTEAKRKRVVILGSGYVSGPVIDYLTRKPNVDITIATNSIAEAKSLVSQRSKDIQQRIRIEQVDVTEDSTSLNRAVNAGDVVVSLVPAFLHPIVAKTCVELRKHMVTASYISPALAAFDEPAIKAGVTIINEVGLDPGIDHLTAKKLIDEVQQSNGKITSFVSWCGGLPAPENSDNPLGYKFSWSPKGVLLAALNSAVYKWDNTMHNIPGKDLLLNAKEASIYKGFAFEGLANRDSMKYIDMYGLGNQNDLSTMFRGTLRYRGYAELLHQFSQLGLLSTITFPKMQLKDGMTWASYIKSLNAAPDSDDFHSLISKKLNLEQSHPKFKRLVEAMEWLEMVNSTSPVEVPNLKTVAPIDVLCHVLQKKLVYAPGERDMVCMHHVFGIETNLGKKSTHTATLVCYGDPIPRGYTAMAKTVGLPAAIATELLLDGKIRKNGVIAPMTKDIYIPMLDRLEAEGIRFVEKTV